MLGSGECYSMYTIIYVSKIFFTIYHPARPEGVLLASAPSYQCLSLTTAVPMAVSKYKYAYGKFENFNPKSTMHT